LLPLALSLVTIGIWCQLHDRFSLENWQYPLTFSGDEMEILVRFKAVAAGEMTPFTPQVISRLGAPFGADWSEYPVSDKLLFLFYGQVTRLLGVYAASNLAVLLAHLTAALAFFGCARFLRVRSEWAFCGALLFAFTYQIVMRGLPHLWLAYAYTVPCALLTCWIVGGAKYIRWPAPVFLFCLLTAAVMGASNPYNLYFFLQLLGLAVVAQWLGDRRGPNLWLGCSCLLVAVGTWALLQSDTWLYATHEGASPLIARNYSGTELYALKPVELLTTPPNHHVEAFAQLGYRYLRWSGFRGESFYPYLGIVGGIGLIWILVELLKRLGGRGRVKLPAYGPQVAWILIFAAIGGINSILSLFFGLHMFRATNRFSIFISAIVCFFVASRMSRLSRKWPSMLSVLCAAVIAAIGLYDQIPNLPGSHLRAEQRKPVLADARFGSQLEAALPRAAMVFQLPAVDFPECWPSPLCPQYDAFRLYLSTNSLRMTYGMLKGRAIAQWQQDYGRLAPSAMVAALEEAGFAAICIDRRGYSDRAEALLAGLNDAGRPVTLKNDLDDFVVVRLQPHARPKPPLAHELTFGEGWTRSGDDGVSWANGPAVWTYYNPFSKPLVASLKFDVRGVDTRHFSLLVNDREKFQTAINENPTQVVIEKIELYPGINRIDLFTAESAVRVSQARYSLKAFAVEHLNLRIAPEASAQHGESL